MPDVAPYIMMMIDPGTTVRPGAPEDTAATLDLVLASGLFGADDIDPVVQLLGDYFTKPNLGHLYLVSANTTTVNAVAYAQPNPAADRLWYLTMIAVHPDSQRSGSGTALLSAVESELLAREQRLLLVETSALPAYDSARQFYRQAGYDEKARVRDFHEDGDDMVLFRKRLLNRTVQ